ncbi:hypothetical protein ACA910_010227 [Epithemia clementina (nom. ined.)]
MIQQSKGKLVSFARNEVFDDGSRLVTKKKPPPQQAGVVDNDAASSAAMEEQQKNIYGTALDSDDCNIFDVQSNENSTI